MKLAWMRLLALALTTLSMLGPCALLAGEAGSAVLDRESRKAVRPPVPSAWMRVAETKRLRHLNFFQHECYLEVRMPRVRLPDGGVRLVEPDWAGKLAGFTLLFEALILTLCREMPFAAVARLVNLSWHRVAAICERYVDLALAEADFSAVARLAVDETSRAKGHDYITLFADADERKVLFVAKGRGADTVEAFADDLAAHGGAPQAIESVSIDMSPAFIKG